MSAARRVLHEKRALIWPVAILLLLNVAVFLAVVYPLSQKVANGESDAAASAASLSAARRDFAAARSTVAGKGQADVELRKFYSDVLPADLSAARRATFLRIDQLANESNLDVLRQTSDPKPVRDSELEKFTHTVVLSGEYRDIRRFIHALETAPEFLVLEHVELMQAEEGRSAINLTVQIATYFHMGSHGD